MAERFLQIDLSNSNNERDLINIKFGNDDILQVNFSKLISQSQYIRDNYNYTEALTSIQTEIDNIEKNMKISKESIKLFFQLIQQEKVNIPVNHYKPLCTLSKYFCIDNLTHKLDEIRENELYDDLNFSIQILLDTESANNDYETDLSSKIENFLRGRVNECIENRKFRELPVSTIYRILDGSDMQNVDLNQLLDFILESVDSRFVLLKFIELDGLRDDKIDRLFEFIEEQQNETKEKMLQYMHFNLSYIEQMRNKCSKLTEDLKDEIQMHEQTKKELDKAKDELNQTKSELVQLKKKIKQIENELSQTKSEIKQYKQTIIIGGLNRNYQFGVKSNSKNAANCPIISPPLILSLDSSSLLSYSIYNCHAVLVTRSGLLLGSGYNNDGRIISSLPKTSIDHFTEFSIKDRNGRKLVPISAVCTTCSTLYMLAKSSEDGRQLVYCDCDINKGSPVFLDIGYEEPVALFGGYYHTAAITEKGEIIFINRYVVKDSPKSMIKAVSLPGGAKAVSIACCEDTVIALSAGCQVFSSPISKKDNNLKFSAVFALNNQDIVFISGTYRHFLAVSSEGRVFGCESNIHGQLGIGNKSSSAPFFTEISSLSEYEISSAYAGSSHSLFVTREGKILSCGKNEDGQLLLSSGPGENVYTPTETTITGGASFCLAGCFVSSAFIGSSPPPNTPNMPIHQSDF